MALFREAYAVYPPGLGSLRNVAECEQALGHFALARRAWLDLGRAASTSTERKYEGWANDAAQAAAELAPRVGTVTITAPPDAEVTLNGERLAPALLGAPLERDPGHYVVTMTQESRPARERSFDLSAGDARRIDLRLAEPQARREPGHSGATERTVAWVALGAGAASLLGAGIAEVERQSALGDADHLKETCPGPSGDVVPPCTASQVQSVNARGDSAAAWETGLVAAGAIGLSSGIALLVWRAARSTNTALVVSPTGLSAMGRF